MTWPCCLNGTLRELPRWEEPPAGDSASRYVWELWRDQSNTGRVYRQYSRAINNALALSHLTVGNQSKHADGKTKTGWNPTIIVNGRVATLMGTLLPAAGAVPKFAQLYTLGGGEEEVALDDHDLCGEREEEQQQEEENTAKPAAKANAGEEQEEDESEDDDPPKGLFGW